MKKSIVIKDPISINNLIKINLKQNVNLFLSKELFPDCILERRSEYLNIHEKENFWIIEQDIKNIEHYQNFSNFYLGEIKIKSKKNNSNLIFILNSINLLKNNFLTIVNPKNFQIKIVPGEILEFVLFNDFLIDDKIICKFNYTNICLFEMIEESFFCENQIDDPQDFSYSKISRSINQKCTQKHFWFRLNKNVSKFLNKNFGTQSVAKLTFICERNNSYFDCDIFVNFNKKYKLKFLNSILLPNNSNVIKQKSAKIKKINFNSLEQDCNFLPAIQDNRKLLNYYDILE